MKTMKTGKKVTHWNKIRETVEEDRSRKALSRKHKEKYKAACKMAGKYPLTCVIEQLENANFEIQGQRLGHEHMKLVAIALLKTDYIYELNFSDNSLGNEGAFYVSELLQHNGSFTHMNISNNDIGIPGLRSILPMVVDNVLFTRLDVSGNGITDEGAKLLAELIETRTGLLEFTANHNAIGEPGAVAIGHALANNDTLEHLDLSWNHIRGKGAIAIAHSLKSNKCLRTLNVEWNGFGKEGARALGESLPENETLTELNVTNNRIDSNGMALLMVGLKTNKTLQVFKAGMNPIHSDVAKHLLLILEAAENSAITHIELSEVSVDEDFMEVLDRLSGKRHLSVKHGKFVRKIPEKPYEPPPIPPRDPLDLMFEFKYEHGYRTLDLLMRMDRDNNMVIDKDEFKYGLLEMGIEASDDDVADIMSRLDANADGSIDYRELMQGEKEYGSRQKRHMNMQTVMKIRSLAAAMMKLKMKSVTSAAGTLAKGGEGTKKKKEKTEVKQK